MDSREHTMKKITFKNQRFKDLIFRGQINYLYISIFNKKVQLLSNPFAYITRHYEYESSTITEHSFIHSLNILKLIIICRH